MGRFGSITPIWIIIPLLLILLVVRNTLISSLEKEWKAPTNHQGHFFNTNNELASYPPYKVVLKCRSGLKGGSESACTPKIRRVADYCASDIKKGYEGTFPGLSKWHLKYVAVLIRHGDRSSIHHMPGSKNVDNSLHKGYYGSEEERLVASKAEINAVKTFKMNPKDEKSASLQELQQQRKRGQGRKSGDGQSEEESGDGEWERDETASMSDAMSDVYRKPSRQFYIDPRALKFSPKLSSFRVEDLSFKGEDVVEGSDEYRRLLALKMALNESAAFHSPDYNLAPGQLTSRGFMQLVEIGNILGQAYASLTKRIELLKQVYIRSTNYERTFQSTAGLVLGMLPQLGGPEGEYTQLPIKTFLDEKMEVMHGVGMKLSSHHVSDKGESILEGTCAKASKLGREERNSFQTSPQVASSLERIFGDGVKGRVITDLVDAVLPSVCHNQPLPCSSQTGECLTESLAADMMAEADRMFCNRYAGRQGLNATMLATYPFMLEIVKALKRATLPDDNNPLGIFTGHDTVIAPVLSALGVYSKPSLCIWPPYASRIVFELWQPKADVERAKARNKATPKLAQEHDKAPVRSLVRVLYNGLDITTMIPACKEALSKPPITAYAGAEKMCPLSAIEEQLQRMLLGAKSHTDACAA